MEAMKLGAGEPIGIPRTQAPGVFKKGTLRAILRQAGIPGGLEDFLQGAYE